MAATGTHGGDGLRPWAVAQEPARGAGQGAGGGRGGGRGFSLPPLLMETDAFPDGAIVPQKVRRSRWRPTGVQVLQCAAGTISYAIIFHDLDVGLQNGTGDVLHWLAWNIPASANGIPEGKLPDGSVQGNNITGQASYMGPAHRRARGITTTSSKLYALNANLDIPQTSSRDDLLKAMQGKVVAKAAYVGRFRQGEAPAPGR